MRTVPYVEASGVARERERAPYTVALVSEGDRYAIAFLPPANDRLTCLELVRAFTIPLREGIGYETARAIAQSLLDNMEGLDAVYAPELPQPPTYPNVVRLRAA